MLFLGLLISSPKTAPVFESRMQVILIQTLTKKVFCQVFARYFINYDVFATLNLGFLSTFPTYLV